MNRFNKLAFSVCIFILLCHPLYSQDDGDSTLYSEPEDTLSTSQTDTLREYISGIIKEINRRSETINLIRVDGELKIKTRKEDEEGSIEIQVNKKDDVWFKIEGPLGIDVAEAHFGRKKFIYLNHLNDEAVTGSTTIINIGTLTKIRCTFDDMLNVFSGTVRIYKSKKDSLSISEDENQFIISLRRGTVTRKYWVYKDNFLVYKYIYYGKQGNTLIQFDFSNFVSAYESSYAKVVEIRRPKQGEYLCLKFESYHTNQTNLNFYIGIPSDYKRKVWK